MSKGNWRVSDILTRLVLFGVLTFAAVHFLDKELGGAHEPISQQDKSTDPNNGESDQPKDYRIFGLIFERSDSIAQWGMLAFTVAATGLLWGTLLQSNKTNQAAIIAANAALDANAIIKQEQRPWVTLERDLFCEFQDLGHKGHITWNFDLQNRGKGPAYDIQVDFEVMKRRHWQGMRQQVSAYRDRLLSQSRVGRTAVLFPGETTENLRFWSDIKTTYKIDEFTGDESFWGEFEFVALMVCVTYRLGPESKDIGFDARIFKIERDDDLFGPWAHKIMEFTNARIIG